MVTALSLSGVSVSTQCLTFLYACLLGTALGLLYDVFRITRKALPLPAAAVAAQDLLFFFLCAFFSFLFLMAETDGKIRWFIAAGEFLGAVLYHLTAGELVMAVSDVIIGAVRWLLRLVWRVAAGVAGLIKGIVLGAARFVWGRTGAAAVRAARPAAQQLSRWAKNKRVKMKKALRSQKIGLKQTKGLLYNSNMTDHRLLRRMRGGRGRGKKKA